jgi:hypothetical protein
MKPDLTAGKHNNWQSSSKVDSSQIPLGLSHVSNVNNF